ncbi:DUF87 domain-containing protein [Actinokineospora sp. NBRC 105648]|uniref:helicase HerA domain-containing protein n=1 Tax=Actinokineospora sp. NBRC 105648 TaxID=3032206 RepID=UPI0024A49270|nr:DUF87 domain-containing protein [Actinokineospora sp. NBRC 105648]GLZ36579.1 ATPase [Actinokineospora sp. NBRC 105648]
MDDTELRALAALRFDWAPTPEDVWTPAAAHVAELNAPVLRSVMAAFADAERSRGPSPLGVVITGQQGAGKTHMLGAVRAEVHRQGGYFFLLSLLHEKSFWQNIVHAIRTGLHNLGPDKQRQLTVVLHRLADRLSLPAAARAQVVGDAEITRATLDRVVVGLRDADPTHGQECRHTARALVLLAAHDPTVQEIGESYLTSASEAVAGERSEWGIHPDAKPAQQVVREISRILALTGPSVLAVDQIDTLVSQSGRSTDRQHAMGVGLPREQLLEQIGSGLMDLRESTHRTVTVVACQPPVWEGIRTTAIGSAADRFRSAAQLRAVPSAEVARALVATRFEPRFVECGFTPAYPTWPVRPDAFEGAVAFTPRTLFKVIDEHIRSCLDSGVVTELHRLDARALPRQVPDPMPTGVPELSTVDAEFAELVRRADPRAAVDKDTEDMSMPALLAAGLNAYVQEQGPDRLRYRVEPQRGANPPLHARLCRTLDEETEDEVHWSFRAIAAPHPRTVQNRIGRVQVTAGLDRDVPKRKAYLLRTGGWSTGTKRTQEMLDEFRALGGTVIEEVDLADLKVFAALEVLCARPRPEVSNWLRARRPAGSTALFRVVFGAPEAGPSDLAPPPPTPVWTEPDATPAEPAPSPRGTEPAPARVWIAPEDVRETTAPAEWPADDPDTRLDGAATADLISLGTSIRTGEPQRVTLESLRKHTVIFAGSGSGKTVLIRRLVEECALRGVSAIVLDPNNDLARLGDPWPSPPGTWGPDDATKAADYLEHTDVVVWTPRRESGRPISFQPLPDLAGVAHDPDEFGLALDIAVAALAPRARADGTTAKAERSRAVLREALSSFARAGLAGLRDFLDYLAQLPPEVTSLANARSMAVEMAQTLMATMINDPLFGGAGEPLDPGVLFTPPPGKRARVSVISMIGLQSDDQRRGFVSQLQMALFAWIKHHPAGDRPLGGLFVMDEAQTLAPSDRMTACTASTLALVAQARKYGLGLVFATQAPKGIHNRIVGNAATQYFGFINSPAQVAAAKEMAAAKASAVLDISRLRAGEFYAVAEGLAFEKVRSPMCLSHHPSSALTPEEVLIRAQVPAPD